MHSLDRLPVAIGHRLSKTYEGFGNDYGKGAYEEFFGTGAGASGEGTGKGV